MAKVRDVAAALNLITGGRLPPLGSIPDPGTNPFVVLKSSGLPGKAVLETPGLVFGDPDREVGKLAVLMTLTESAIELAGATGVDALVAHHPIADAASSGGVTLKNYLGLYNLAAFELHEAFHGLHPGMSYLHGHAAYRVEIAWGGVPGNIFYVARALPEVKTLGDMLQRIRDFLDTGNEERILNYEKRLRDCPGLQETNVTVTGRIILGQPDSQVNYILHIFPHTGFSPADLERAVRGHREVDTVLVSVSRVLSDGPLVDKCRELGLNLVAGSSHAAEILENGLPLAKAIQSRLPGVEVVIFREKMTSYPLECFGSGSMKRYGEMIARKYLLRGE